MAQFTFKQSVKPKGATPNVATTAPQQAPETHNKSVEPPKPAAFQIVIPGKGVVNGGEQTAQPKAPENPVQASVQSKPEARPQEQLSTGLNYPDQVEGVDPAVYKDFLEAKHILHDCLNQKAELIGLALRRVMVSLQEHPELAEFMLPEDQGAMIKSLRHSYNVTLAIKEKKKRKKKVEKPEPQFDISDLANLVME